MTVAVKIENVSKLYHIGKVQQRHDTLRDLLAGSISGIFHRNGNGRDEETIWALKDINLEVQRGEVLGIIGRNGAGKSTLLKIMSRITEPTSGWVGLNGRVASLLEVGTGFHPELTGRENIFLNGAILGMQRQEITRKFDEIVAFAEIEKFLDTPVKRYSSGMYVRLAFGVAAHLEPEILLVDEVLAVGDVEFQKKCLGKMSKVAQEGRTVLFVSHNLAAISNLCKRGIVIEKGNVLFDNTIEKIIPKYFSIFTKNSDYNLSNCAHLGSSKINFKSTWLEDQDGNRVETIYSGQTFSIVGEYFSNTKGPFVDPFIAINIRDTYGIYYTDLWNQGAGYSWDALPTAGQIVCTIPNCPLNEGLYYYSIFCRSKNDVLDHIVDAGRINVEKGDFYGTGKLPQPNISRVLFNQSWQIREA
jgi:lipopolysaccharide transport system ATP-binding protein